MRTICPSEAAFSVSRPTPSTAGIVIIIVGALTFFPAFSLGPLVEHLLMDAGTVF